MNPTFRRGLRYAPMNARALPGRITMFDRPLGPRVSQHRGGGASHPLDRVWYTLISNVVIGCQDIVRYVNIARACVFRLGEETSMCENQREVSHQRNTSLTSVYPRPELAYGAEDLSCSHMMGRAQRADHYSKQP